MKLPLASFALALLAASRVSGAKFLRGSTAQTKNTPRDLQDQEQDQVSSSTHLPLVCRMLMLNTLYLSGDDMTSQEESACVPIMNGKETDALIPLKLPVEVESAHRDKLEGGQLFVEITNAEVNHDKGTIVLSVTSTFSAIENATGGLRHLQEHRPRRLQVIGEQTLAIVRVVSGDGVAPTATAADFEAMMNPKGGINIYTQVDKCSIGQFHFQKAANRFVVDVRLDTPVSVFNTPDDIVNAAQSKLLQSIHDVNEVNALADKVIFCMPPGSGDWVGIAGNNHWRVLLNNDYCTSLSAAMHELGHSIGLSHANERGIKYMDTTGYMSASDNKPDWPQRCYNGQNSFTLGWYDAKTMELDGGESPRLINLGSIVDYDKAETVLVSLQNRVFLMYNRAKDFNVNTGKWADSVTVTETAEGGSELLAGLRPGEQYRYHGDIVIEACQRVNDGNPDRMIISVGKGGSACGEVLAPIVVHPATPTMAETESSHGEETPFPAASAPQVARPSPVMPAPVLSPVTQKQRGDEKTPFPTTDR